MMSPPKQEATQILVGYKVGSGEAVYMSPKHTLISGMTGDAGKTTLIEGICSRWPGEKFVVFLAKPGEQAFATQRRILPFFRQKAGWQYVEALIQASLQEKIKIIRTTLIKVCEGTKTLDDVFGNVSKRIAQFDQKGKGGFEHDMLIQVKEYLRQVIKELEEHELADSLDLKEGINVVDLTDFSPVMQAMVVGAIAEEILRNHKNTSIVIPEAWQTIPGDRGSPATASVEALIRQGRVQGNFVLIDSQDIAGVNTKIRRHIANYLLGKQQDEHEIERTLKAISLPPKSKPKADEIQTLKRGQFFAVLNEQVVKIYARPAWMDEHDAKKIAENDTTTIDGNYVPSNVKDWSATTGKAEGLYSREFVDSLNGDLQIARQTAQELVQEVKKLKAERDDAVEENKAKAVLLDQFEKEIMQYKAITQAFTGVRDYIDQRIRDMTENTVPIRNDGSIPVDIEIANKRSDMAVRVVRERVVFDEDSVEGVICRLIKEGELDSPKSAGKIHKHLSGNGYAFDEGMVRATLDRFTMSPYHLLLKKKEADRTWTYRTDKAEAEQAFKEVRK